MKGSNSKLNRKKLNKPKNNILSPSTVTSLSTPNNAGTPQFIQCILLFVVMVIIIGGVVTFRAHLSFENIPHLPADYKAQFLESTSEVGLSLESPTQHHIIDAYHMIEKLEIHNHENDSHCSDMQETTQMLSSLNVIQDVSKIHIWPLPQEYTIFQETVPLNMPFKFESNVKHRVIDKAIERYTNIIFPHQTNKKHDIDRSIEKLIIYVMDEGKDDKLDIGFNEEYEILVHDPLLYKGCNSILLKSQTIYGALRGIETLSQMITYNFATDEYIINVGIVRDFPRFTHRGVMLDTSRHWHPVAGIKRFLLSLSFVKFNVFHWHIVDEESFPYYSNRWPKLWNGSYSKYERYSESDILEIIQYSEDLGIRVIPEFDTPGHAGSWCKGYPELCISSKCREPSPHLLDPSNPFTFELIEGLFAEAVQERFHDSLFHVGSDEVIHDCYSRDPKVNAWKKKEGITLTKGVYKYFVDKTVGIVQKLGKRPIVWNEVYDNFYGSLDKNVIVQLWQGGERQKRPTIIKNGFDIIVSYGWYLDHLKNDWKDMYINDPTDGLSEAQKKKVLGGEACMWSERIDLSNLLATVWPKASTVAERLWSSVKVKDTKTAQERYKYLRCLFIRRGIGASPTINLESRVAPPIQKSCLQQ